MRRFMQAILLACALCGLSIPAFAQGTVPLALVQQFGPNGVPLAGCLLYTYQAGTVATPQNSYQDFGLTQLNPDPLECDQYGRVPMFWLANGLIHIRLTDSAGLVYLDTTMQVLGPSSGSGGGGATVDPTSIFATGDVKFRPTSETLTGWVKMAGLTIGSATSGATERANADTQNLFVYLWSNCHLCSVSGSKGTSALADFNANKTISLPDWRARTPVGLDNMDNTSAGILQSKNVTSPGDTVTTPGATGGEAVHTLSLAEAPQGQFTMTDPGHTHQILNFSLGSDFSGGGTCCGVNNSNPSTTTSSTTGITLTDHSGGGNHNVMDPLVLGTYYIKL